jgi:2-oxoglutarate dehydrogenase E2 component (dihydrolipoamide succinyltransferase)
MGIGGSMHDTKIEAVLLPKISESVHSARIVKWLKKVGDSIKVDEALVEVSTAKVNSEIPSPVAGVIQSIAANESQEVAVGGELCKIGAAASASPQEKKAAFLSPAVLKMANENNICVQSLQSFEGSGHEGRVTKSDVEKMIGAKQGTTDRSELSQSLMNAHTSIPDASLIIDLKMQNLVKWMQEKRASFEKEHGVKVTYTAHILKALALAMVDFKHLQADGACNIGLAVQKGEELFVPVIENVDKLSLSDIARKLEQLQFDPKKSSSEAKITLSNFGKSGVQIGLPIVPEGQHAILALGALEKRVVVTDNDAIKIESRAWATLAFDHRVFDGMYGARFLKTLVDSFK